MQGPPVSDYVSHLIWNKAMNRTIYSPAFKEEVVRKVLLRG